MTGVIKRIRPLQEMMHATGDSGQIGVFLWITPEGATDATFYIDGDPDWTEAKSSLEAMAAFLQDHIERGERDCPVSPLNMQLACEQLTPIEENPRVESVQ